MGKKIKILKGGILCLLLLSILSCSKVIKTDIKSLLNNPEEYKGKKIILTTDLKDLNENIELYLNKRIEISGYVKYNGYKEFKTWNFILKDKDIWIRCYEDNYRIEAWSFAVDIIRMAVADKNKVTVVGKFKIGFNNELLLELDDIQYKDYRVDTDYKPSNIRFPFW